MCSFVVIIVIISAYIISLRIPCSTVEMETPRDAPSRGMLIRIKAVIYVDWELPDKFRGKEGRWSVGSLCDRRWSSSFPMGVALTFVVA